MQFWLVFDFHMFRFHSNVDLAIPRILCVNLDLIGWHHEGALGAVGGLGGSEELLQLQVQPQGGHLQGNPVLATAWTKGTKQT